MREKAIIFFKNIFLGVLGIMLISTVFGIITKHFYIENLLTLHASSAFSWNLFIVFKAVHEIIKSDK